MMQPQDALEILDEAYDKLNVLKLRDAGFDYDRALDTHRVQQQIGFMRDELWAATLQHDPAIGEALWAWLQALLVPATTITASGTLLQCALGHRWVWAPSYRARYCPTCGNPGSPFRS